MEKLRTPEEAFIELKNFSYEPKYVSSLPSYTNLRLHYIDENSHNKDTVFLCLHGQPTWSYLYRKMIPIFAQTGARVVAPDFFGFGRSDKPVNEMIYTFQFHRQSLFELIEFLELRNITLVCQDWGGIIGFSLFPTLKDKINRLLIMNTLLPEGSFISTGFENWRKYNRSQDDLNISKLISRSDPDITNEELIGYDLPFPDRNFKAGVRKFPELMMDKPNSIGLDDMRKAKEFLANSWKGDSFMAIGAKDPVIDISLMTNLSLSIKNCPKPMILKNAGHFVQEKGEIVANAALNYWN